MEVAGATFPGSLGRKGHMMRAGLAPALLVWCDTSPYCPFMQAWPSYIGASSFAARSAPHLSIVYLLYLRLGLTYMLWLLCVQASPSDMASFATFVMVSAPDLTISLYFLSGWD